MKNITKTILVSLFIVSSQIMLASEGYCGPMLKPSPRQTHTPKQNEEPHDNFFGQRRPITFWRGIQKPQETALHEYDAAQISRARKITLNRIAEKATSHNQSK